MTHLEQFESYMMSEKMSAHTIRAYTSDVKAMLDFIGKEDAEIGFIDITSWQNSMSDKCGATINRKIKSIKKYFDMLINIGVINKNPCVNIKSRKTVDSKTKEYIPIEDAKHLIDVGKNSRDRAIVSVYLTTGLRVSELINLTLDDFYSENGFEIIAKGQVKRYIKFNDSCREYIEAYLKDRKCGCENLFVSNGGTPMRTESLTRTLKVLASRAGVSTDISNHSLRHTFISTVADNYGIHTAQHVIGHSDIKTTQRYSHTSKENILNVIDSIMI